MSIVKKVLIIIISLFVLILIVALFVKKDMKAEREIVINKPKREVFEYIKSLKNQNNYSKWASIDPNMKTHFSGTDGTVGFVSGWESLNSKVGKGEQTITGIKEGERMDSKLHFIEPFESIAQAHLITEAVSDNQTKVKWGFEGKMNYPLNILNLIMNPEKSVGDDFSTGLNNLKAILEK